MKHAILQERISVFLVSLMLVDCCIFRCHVDKHHGCTSVASLPCMSAVDFLLNAWSLLLFSLSSLRLAFFYFYTSIIEIFVWNGTGDPDGRWRVDLPAAEVPPELPEPVLGINFAREGMKRKDWFALCAVHSDAWLMSILFFYAARYNAHGRAELFDLVNQHPTVYEVVTGHAAEYPANKRRNSGNQTAEATGNTVPYIDNVLAELIKPGSEPYVPADGPSKEGRHFTAEDVTPALVGRKAELLWPDDGKWYLIVILELDVKNRMAKVCYATGEEETLSLDEAIENKEICLLPA